MRILHCSYCDRITAFEKVEDSQVVDGTALRCQCCQVSQRTAQTTLPQHADD